MNRLRICLKAALAAWMMVPCAPLDGLRIFEVHAATYYVSSTGSDSNNGTTSSTPWQTIARVNQANSLFDPGDMILFKSGETFRGRLQLSNRSGITIGTYPIGAAPAVLKGSQTISFNPNDHNGAVYYVDLPDPPAFISHVYEAGQLMQVARFPNYDPNDPEAGFRRNGAGTGYTIMDAGLPGNAGYWEGAWAVVRTANWQYQMREVTTHTDDGSVDALTLESTYALNGSMTMNLDGKDWGYYLVNKLSELDAPGEWFYDPSIGRLYVMSVNDGQMPDDVEYVTESIGVYLASCNTITLQGLVFSHYSEAGVRLAGTASVSHTITISDCSFSDLMIGIRDLAAAGLPGRTVDNCRFERCYLYGVRATWGNGTVSRCTFQDIGLWSGFQGLVLPNGSTLTVLGNEYGSYSAISIVGDGVVIERNAVIQAGNNGILLYGASNRVEHNYVSGAQSLVNDGAGITFDNCDGMTVLSNVVRDVHGNLHGAATNTGNYERKATGIYFGNGGSETNYIPITNTSVQDNVVTGCSDGILVDHEPGFEGNRVIGNTVFGCSENQLLMQDLGLQNFSTYQAAYDTEVSSNILYCLDGHQRCLTESQTKATALTGSRAIVDMGSFSDNAYFQPFCDVPIAYGLVSGYAVSAYPGDPNLTEDASDELKDRVIPFTLQGWRSLLQEDQGSFLSPLRQKDFQIDGYTSAELSTYSDHFAAGVSDWSNLGALCDAPADGGGFLHSVECPWVEKGCGTCYEYITGAVAGTYEFSFSMRSEETDALRLAPIYDPTKKFSGARYFSLGPEWRSYSFVVDVPEGTNTDLLYTSFQNMQFAFGFRANSTIDLDDVVVRKCTLNPVFAEDIALNHILRYNCPIAEPSTQNIHQSGVPEGQPSVFDVPGDPGQCWSDVFGNFYAAGDQIPLDEWASIILFRMDVPDGNLALDGNNEHHITSNTTWSEHMNVTGSIVVDAGKTLTIDGAHIGFAESTPSLTTNLVVQPGGNLILRNGATLRNWMGCSAPAAMWDGVKVLGNGTTIGAGLVVMESGARITDALTALRCSGGEPNTIFGGDDNSGGVVQATNAVFENNLYDVVTRPHAVVDPAVWGPSSFTNCTFRRTRALHDAQLPPGARVSLMGSASTPFTSCTFENTTGDYKGMGIQAIGTRVLVEGGEEPQTRSRFQGLDFAMLHSAYSPEHLADVDRCDFVDNKRGILIAGADNCKVTRSTFTVADKPVTDLSVEGAYGAYLYGCTAFELEENTFVGIGTEHPKVGLVLRNTGIADIAYYNNTFNAFADASERSCGTVIMGTNADQNGVGLRIKCNDYSASGTNDYDVAFTGNAVRVANEQGTGANATTPAGNTFANVDPLTCDGNDARHLYEDVENALNAFGYWHHLPQPAVELVPHCNNAQVAMVNTNWVYDKPITCPVDLSGLVPIGDDEVVAGDAHAEFDELKEVYSDWRDGGDTEGLIDFIMDPGNDSYAVRNRLMLVAPKVGEEAWKVCFTERNPALNPWHFAQALLANSPLEPSVLELLKESDLPPFYKELVEDGQNGGTSMHSIYKSEIAHLNGVKSGALQAMVRKALRSGESNTLAMAAQALADYPTAGMESEAFAMHLATGDLQSARDVVDMQVQLAGVDKDLWQVYDLWLSLLEDNKKPTDLDGAGVSTLQGIAGSEGIGAAQAGAWLALLGAPVPEVVLLPNSTKRLKPQKERAKTTEQPLLAVYPNPSRGPAYFNYSVAEGVDRAELRLHDAHGRLLSVKRLATQNGILELQSNELPAGVVLANLYWDGIPVEGIKLNMIR